MWGEPLDRVSRETQVPAHELEGWQRRFLEAGPRELGALMLLPPASHGVVDSRWVPAHHRREGGASHSLCRHRP